MVPLSVSSWCEFRKGARLRSVSEESVNWERFGCLNPPGFDQHIWELFYPPFFADIFWERKILSFWSIRGPIRASDVLAYEKGKQSFAAFPRQ